MLCQESGLKVDEKEQIKGYSLQITITFIMKNILISNRDL